MQAPITQLPGTHELFTRERRRSRMQQFLQVFERTAWPGLSPMPEMVPVKASSLQVRSTNCPAPGGR